MVCFPAWCWTDEPELRFLTAANDGRLATRDAVAMRELVTSDWYRYSFFPQWGIKDDQDQKTWFTNDAGGHRVSQSVNEKVTGKKGDILLVDDADDAKKVHSEAERESVHTWFDLGFSGRVADERNSPIIVIGQRLRKDDLIGHCKEKGGWTELRLSEEYDPATHCSTSIWSDPRNNAGEFLRPSRFGPVEKADAIKRLTEEGYDGQHNQNPRASAGTWFDEANIAGFLPYPPVGTIAVRFWDMAATTGEASCETAGVLIGRIPDGRFCVVDVVHGKWQPVDRTAAMKATAQADKRRNGVRVISTWIEEEPGSSGIADVQAIIRELAGCFVQPWKESGNKDVRIRPFAGQWQSRNVLLCEGAWNAAYLAQIRTIPGGKKRDMADASAGAFNRLTDGPSGSPTIGLPNPGQATNYQLPADVFR